LIEVKLSLFSVKPETHEKKGYKKPESHLWDSGSNSKSINKNYFKDLSDLVLPTEFNSSVVIHA
jgi:hypothetical protein